jgi:hypothetical protein
MNRPAKLGFSTISYDVPTCMEVRRLHLIRFPSEVALADIFAIVRLAVLQTHYIECLAPSSAATEPTAWIFRHRAYRELAGLMYEAEYLWNAAHDAGVPK